MNKIITAMNWFMLGFLCALIMILGANAYGAEQPRKPITSAIATLCDTPTPDGVVLVLFVDVKYADGTSEHFDGNGLHKDAGEIMRLTKHLTVRKVHCSKGIQA